MTTAPAPLEHMYGLRELAEAGYGDRRTITKMIHDGRVPAVRISNTFKIRESDLQFIGAPIGGRPAGDETARSTADPGPADLVAGLGYYVKALVDKYPTLDASRKAALDRLLGTSA